MVPRLLKGLPMPTPNVKDEDRTSRFPRQHHWSRLGDVPRPTRSVNGKGAIEPFFQTPRHHRQPAQASPRRTPLGRPKSQPLDHLARPPPVERRRVHYHHAAVARPPRHRDNHTVPKRPDTLLLCRVHLLGMLPARSEEHTSELQSQSNLVCRLLLEKK